MKKRCFLELFGFSRIWLYNTLFNDYITKMSLGLFDRLGAEFSWNFSISPIIFSQSQITLRSNVFSSSFLLTRDNAPVQNGHGVLSRLVLCILDMELAYSVLYGYFGPVYLLQVSKNDEEHCFLKVIWLYINSYNLVILRNKKKSLLEYRPRSSARSCLNKTQLEACHLTSHLEKINKETRLKRLSNTQGCSIVKREIKIKDEH